MGCCGQKRAKVTTIPKTRGIANKAEKEISPQKVRVTYVGNNSLTVHGTFTGTQYYFSPQNRTRLVNINDSHTIVGNRYYNRYFRLINGR